MAITKFVQLPYKAMNYKNKWLKIIFPKLVEKKALNLSNFMLGMEVFTVQGSKNYLKEKNFLWKKTSWVLHANI